MKKRNSAWANKPGRHIVDENVDGKILSDEAKESLYSMVESIQHLPLDVQVSYVKIWIASSEMADIIRLLNEDD